MRKTNSFTEILERIDDPRSGKNTQHKLIDIIVLAICGVTAGNETWEEIEEYGLEKQEWLKTILELPNGIPSHDTVRRLFIRMKPEAFEEAFQEWTQNQLKDTSRDFVAIDGKTLRPSHDHAHKKSAVHIVSAFSSGNSLVLGQM